VGTQPSRDGTPARRRDECAHAKQLTDTASANLIKAITHITRPALVPELQVLVAEELMPTWEAAERHAGHAVAPPFWAFVWPGSQALARLILDRPQLVAGKRVFDFGSGGGLAAIAAAKVGAQKIVAGDIDALAAQVQQANATLNGVHIESTLRNMVGRPLPDFEVVLAGDVCYERSPALEIVAWLRRLARTGVEVLLADPGRAYAPSDGVIELESYEVPTTRELESTDELHTTVWRLATAARGRVAWGTSTSRRR
jgi:predicted nicotinamide N-methyase